ncbi:MAG: carbohydrate binding family 9 domain-containing protein [Bacteroidales bacterium]|nr:carbohydrate binding family 9 domain-containing protein [Bacteroidales bacterium]
MRTYFIILLSFLIFPAYSQVEKRFANACKVEIPPKIDGNLNDICWTKCNVIEDFTQFLPNMDASPSFPSEVRVAYDDQALYVAAYLKDPFPDSIPMQLGNRDDENLNVDYFGIGLDTYDNQLDAYTFIVTAGVQIDYREKDDTYDGVWLSEARLTHDGWVVEIKIPYSAIRFPKIPNQVWGLQLIRSIRRYRETDYWAMEKPGADNNLVYWGELRNIENIEPPVRLSFTPYLASSIQHYPDSVNRHISTSFVGGLDLKYGLNESFTLDMTLLPDFSQVQSDNQIKNLTAFETVYTEQRPFFKEAVDLFQKGDLFYSRRIGAVPQNYYSVESQVLDEEEVSKNPIQQQLINSTKFSGRTSGGLAIGILNAVTGNTYATLKKPDGSKRNYLTDPATNYNMIVLAQALKNNSEVFLSNSNVIRSKGYDDANVTAAGIKLNDKSNTYVLNINGGLSQNYSREDSTSGREIVELGYKAYAGVGKTNGNFQFTLVKGAMNRTYDANDMGLTFYNNYHYNYASFYYNLYQPWWKFRDMHNSVILTNENNYTTGKVQKANLKISSFSTTLKYLSLWTNIRYDFLETFDYYEPRYDGRYFLQPRSLSVDCGFSSDYRKKFALDAVFQRAVTSRDNGTESSIDIHPIIRFSNHFLFNYIFSFSRINNQVGYASTVSNGISDSIIFGSRDVVTVINTISAKYLFRNNLSLNLNTRHYWAKGNYDNYSLLLDNGRISEPILYNNTHNFNFNVFTVDMVFSWIFAPGSSFNFVWKNAINPPDQGDAVDNYFNNLKYTFDSPQRNTLSFKILYYLDYQQIKKRAKR